MGRHGRMGVVIRGLISGEHSTGGGYWEFVNARLTKMAARANATLPEIAIVYEAAPIPAFVAQGQWVVDCPDCGRNRSMVWLTEPLYMCPACWNQAIGGDWRRVELPAEREHIEALLLARTLREARNWLPGETLDDLRAENEALGVAA